MAANGYPQQYSRGPPPLQHYDQDPRDRMIRQPQPQPQPQPQSRQHAMYNQQAQVRNGLHHRDVYEQNGYNDQYVQNGQRNNRNGGDAQQYGQPGRQYGQMDQHRVQHYDQGFGPEAYNQYDERRPGNGYVRPPPQHAQSYGPASGSEVRRQPLQVETHAPREQKRILKQPESPKSIPWDNPFGAFPTKKKQSEGRNTHSSDGRSDGVKSPESRPTTSSGRPSTSHENRQQPEASRPTTSHSQRPRGPPNNGSQYQEEILSRNVRPQRADGPMQEPDVAYPSQRPMPRRAMTGPSPQDIQQYHPPAPRPQRSFYNQPVQQIPQQAYNDHPLPPQQNWENDSHQAPPPNNRVAPSQTNHYQHDASYAQHQQGPDTFERQTREERPVEQFDPSSYRGIPLRRKISPDMPNFDAISPISNERFEDQLTPIRSGTDPAYRKATYQAAEVSRPSTNLPSQPRDYNEDSLNSPLNQFSYNNPEYPADPIPRQVDAQLLARQAYGHNQPQEAQSQENRPQQQGYNSSYQRDPPSASHFPPRAASRADGRTPLSRDGFDQRAPFPQSNQLSGRPTYEQSYSQNSIVLNSPAYPNKNRPPYQQNFDQQTPATPLNLTQTVDDGRREEQRMGYDPRLRRESDSMPPHDSQPAPRPQTSNSNRHPSTGGHDRRVSVETFRSNMTGRSNTDLQSRPVPFRPGLMQSPPPPAPTVSNVQPPPVQRVTPATQNAEPKPGPVTVQELNMLRESFKASPNDHALGLKFAKRLVDAARVLANENGRADPKQTAKNRERYVLDAHKVVKRLISAGYPEAMFYMADCYGQGLLGLQPDPKEAFSLYQSAAKAGHAQGSYRVAVCCELGPEDGGGTRRDPLKAVQWYKRAATLGDTPAMYKMGMIQLKGLLGQPRNPREAISWLKRAAEKADAENPHALHELALLYESAQSTDIVIRDEKYALQLFSQAAELGYKYSQFRLGSVYEYGLLGCPIDPRLSIVWYSRAAAQGEHQSEFALSGWYLTGSGSAPSGERPLLEQSDTEAYLWARKAATSGLTKAEYAMGYYTEVGIGVAANVEEAKKWYFRAAAQSHPKARERLEELKRGGARMQKTRVSRSQVDKHNEGECNVM